MILAILAIVAILCLCAYAAGQNAETRKTNALRDRLRAYEVKTR